MLGTIAAGGVFCAISERLEPNEYRATLKGLRLDIILKPCRQHTPSFDKALQQVQSPAKLYSYDDGNIVVKHKYDNSSLNADSTSWHLLSNHEGGEQFK